MSEPMLDEYHEAIQELKRADHSIYATLKYTRTQDVVLTILERFVRSTGLAILACLKKMQDEGKLDEIPKNKKGCEIEFRKFFPQFEEEMNLYNKLKRLLLSDDFKCEEEYRRNMTIIAILDGGEVRVTVDDVEAYYKMFKEFVKQLRPILNGEESD